MRIFGFSSAIRFSRATPAYRAVVDIYSQFQRQGLTPDIKEKNPVATCTPDDLKGLFRNQRLQESKPKPPRAGCTQNNYFRDTQTGLHLVVDEKAKGPHVTVLGPHLDVWSGASRTHRSQTILRLPIEGGSWIAK